MSFPWRRAVLIAALVALLPGPGGIRPRPTPGFLRIDQVGFLPGETKIAYLLTPRDVTGARVTAVDAGGREAWTGQVSPSRGAWNGRYHFVQPIDLSGLTRRGTYRLKVNGQVTAESPPFRVADGPALFGPLTANAVRYLQQHRDGAAHPSDQQATVYDVPTFAASGEAAGPMSPAGGPVDVQGGWYDAGDYLKFTHTTAYALILMLMVERGPVAVPGLAAESRHGLDWLDKMWDADTRTLYMQVGIGDGLTTGDQDYLGDHDTWRLPRADAAPAAPGDASYYQRHRPVFRAAEPGRPISPNLAGRVAAAFALAAQIEAPGDPDRARSHLDAAAGIFALADTHPTGDLITTAPRDYYPEDSWHDDLALAAVELARAATTLHDPRAADWQRQAADRAQALFDDEDTDTLSVYDVGPLVDAELGPSAPLGKAAIRDLRARVAAAAQQAARDPFNAAAGTGSSDYAAQQLGYAATADLYRSISGDSRYAALATAQRDVTLGANGWGTSMVVGAGTTYPRCPHDPITDLAPGRPEPVGAVVNGPNRTSRVRQVIAETRPSPCSNPGGFARFDRTDSAYTDDAGDSANTEPAIDFTATGLFTFAVAAAAGPWQKR